MPGQGLVGPLSDAPVLRQYLADLTRLARAAVASQCGRSADEAALEPVPEPYRDWGFDSFFATNLRFLHG